MAKGDANKQQLARSCPTCGLKFDTSISFCPHDGTKLSDPVVSGNPDDVVKLAHDHLSDVSSAESHAQKQRAASLGSAERSEPVGDLTRPTITGASDATAIARDRDLDLGRNRNRDRDRDRDRNRDDADLVGKTLDEQYEVIEVIGRGGMSIVYKARHLLLKRTVAIKTLLPHLMLHPLSLHRFQVEAQAASNLRHPNVITVYDFGTTPDGQPYLVMDYLEGESLGDILVKQHHLPSERALRIFIQVADALAHAHDKGIIHRDLKPTNILLLDNGGQKDFVNIVDFGIAKLLPHEGSDVVSLTQTGEVFGSPMYMSPEQCRGEKLDSRADIYSMGCLMYETLSGRTPVESDNTMEVLFKHINEVPRPMSGGKIHVPDQLERIVFKALAKDPAQRYQSMGQLKDEMQSLLNVESTTLLKSLAGRWELFWLKRKPRTVAEKATLAIAVVGLSAAFMLAAQLGWLYWNAANSPATSTQLVWDQDRTVQVSPATDDVNTTVNAMIHFKSAQIMIEQGKPPEEILAFLRNGIDFAKQHGQYSKAAKLAGLAARFAIQENGMDSFPAIQWQKEYADCLLKALDYKTAANAIEPLVGMVHYLGALEKAQVLGNLGDAFYFQSRWQDSAHAYHDAIKAFSLGFDQAPGMLKDTQEVALVFSRLATCYDRLADKALTDGHGDESNELRRSAASEYKSAYDRWRTITGDVCDNESVALVNYLRNRHMLDKSANLESDYQKALHDVGSLYGKDSAYYGVTVSNRSGYLWDQGDWIGATLAKIESWTIFSKIK